MRPVRGLTAIVRAVKAVLTSPNDTNVLGSCSLITDRVPSRPFELKTSLRFGSNAAASVPAPIGNEVTVAPVSVFTTTSRLFTQLENRRWFFGSTARPWGLSQLG